MRNVQEGEYYMGGFSKIAVPAAVAGVAVAAVYNGLTVKKYKIKTNKIKSRVRIVHVSDLHCCVFGQAQSTLVEKIRDQKPDFIAMTGDILDDIQSVRGAEIFLKALGNNLPMYYCVGNHEISLGNAKKAKDFFSSFGVNICDGTGYIYEKNGSSIAVCGVDDPIIGEIAFKQQLTEASAFIKDDKYTVLLSHRPERFPKYAAYGFDLVLSGHAHGGQWRIPIVLNGLFAPNQGFFPKYAGGKYFLDKTCMVVSRGLSKKYPYMMRIFNPPELTVVDIVPDRIK